MAAKKKVASNSPKGAKTTAEKIKTAIATKKVRDTVVFLDKNQPAFANKKNEAKNIRKKLDSDKTAMRAKIIQARRNKPLNITLKDEREMARAMAKANAAKKAAAGATPKPTVKATKKPMTASEKAFIKNQKEKAKATKRTGVYPNTAN
jgi:hypothetical protein